MPEKHFYEQKDHTINYMLPYFKKYIPNFSGLKVLEVGCAEAGLMDILSKNGFNVSGVEIDAGRAQTAMEMNEKLQVYVGDISDDNVVNLVGGDYDLIIMREVIEHVPDKETTFRNLNKLLKPGGFLYISFPPKYSAFAGHQQVGLSLLKAVPYVHLFPKTLLKPLVKMLKEHPNFINHVKMNYRTGMGIRAFEKLVNQNNFAAIVKELFLFRPIYKLRFGLPTVKVPNIRVAREMFTFGYECLLQKK